MAEAQAVVVPVQPSPTLISAATGVVDALKASPMILLIVLLNGFFCGAAGYYLLQVEHYRADDRKALITLLERCTLETVPAEYLRQQHQPKE